MRRPRPVALAASTIGTMSALGVYLVSTPAPPEQVTHARWRGVFVGDDEAPETIVAWLADRVRESGGDVHEVIRRLIPESFVGWAELLANEPLEEPVAVSPDALEATTFVYVFDVGARRLDVFATHADACGERVGSLSFDEQGRVGPWKLVVPVPPRLLSPVVADWTGSKPFADAESRSKNRAAFEGALRERGLQPGSAIAELSHAIANRWRSACRGATKVLLPPDDVSAFWDVRVGELEVWFPIPGQRNSVFVSPTELRLFAAGEGEPVVVPYAFDLLPEALGVDARVIDALREVVHETGWVFLVLELLRGDQRPE